MEVKTLKFEEVVKAFYNPRKLFKKKDKGYKDLKKSLETYGSVEPMVVNDVNMRLISGHQRLQVMTDMGLTEAEFSIVHIEDETEEKALNISLNKIEGRFDKVKLTEVLRDIKDEIDITDLGFKMTEVEDILAEDDEDLDGELEDTGLNLEDRPINKTPANVMLKLGDKLTYMLTPEDYKYIETSCIQQGFFTDKEIAEEIKRRLLYDKAD